MSDKSVLGRPPRQARPAAADSCATADFAALAAGVAPPASRRRARLRRRPQTPAGQTGGTMGPHDTSAGAAALRPPRRWTRCTRRASRPSRRRPPARATSCSAADRQRREGLRAHREEDPVGDRARDSWSKRGRTTTRFPVRRSALREGDRVRVDSAQRAAGIDGHALSRPRAAERHGRRAVHHAAAGEAGPVVHVRVHGAERRLAHVPLASQLGEAGRTRAARRVHRRAEGPKASTTIADVDEVLILNDGAHGYTFNGKSFPATQPLVAKLGQKLRIRFMNEGMMIHPMHLHGMHMTVDREGWLAGAGAVEVRHAQRRARRALGRHRQLQQPWHVGLPLPHPPARRVRAWYVRNGDGARRAEVASARGRVVIMSTCVLCQHCRFRRASRSVASTVVHRRHGRAFASPRCACRSPPSSSARTCVVVALLLAGVVASAGTST